MLLGSAYNWLRRSARHRRRTNLIAARRHKHASETTIDLRSNRDPNIEICTSEPAFSLGLGLPFTIKSKALSYNPKTWTLNLFHILQFSIKGHEITHSINYGLSPINKLKIHF